jgi:DNA-binding transcriptional regulator YiaG
MTEYRTLMTARAHGTSAAPDDPKRHSTVEDRAREDESKGQMIDAERGRKLAALRRREGLTQAQVAERMGVTQGRVSQMERGHTHLTTTTMAAYLEAIGGELTILATVGNLSVRL